MRRSQRPLPSPKLARSSFVQHSPITLMRNPYRCWQSPYLILRSTGNCSWSCRLGLEDEKRRPDARRGMARWTADRAVDMIRDRFGWEAVGYGSVVLGLSRSVPDEFREAGIVRSGQGGGGWAEQSWSVPSSVDEMLAAFPHAGEKLRRMIGGSNIVLEMGAVHRGTRAAMDEGSCDPSWRFCACHARDLRARRQHGFQGRVCVGPMASRERR